MLFRSLIDTPGIDELDGEAREALATEVARRADILIMVCEGDLTRREFAALRTLAARQRPVLLVLNKADRYDREELTLLRSRLIERCAEFLPSGRILTAMADPRPATIIRVAGDGSESEISRSPPPR